MTSIGTAVPFIRVRGAPYERGFERGRTIPHMIHARIAAEVKPLSPARRAAMLAVGRLAEQALAAALPDVLEEMRGIADGAQVSRDDVTVAFAGMRGSAFVPDECSCFVASCAATRTGESIVMKLADLPPSMSTDSLVVIGVEPDRGRSYVTVGYYPEQAVQPEGMNDAGLTVVGAGQQPSDGRAAMAEGRRPGVSVYDVLYRIYRDCATVDEAIDVLAEGPRGFTGRTMIVADAAGDWAKIEVGFNQIAVRRPEPDAAYRTNFVAAGVMGVFTERATHDLVLSRREDPDAYRRYDRYLDVLTKAAGGIDVATAIALAQDHDGGPGSGSICKHSQAFRTLGAVVFQPAQRRALIANGPPCETEFIEIGLFG
jgi:predicted choloylglycine hydrolase